MQGRKLMDEWPEGHHEGRVHSQFNQLKSDQGGTVEEFQFIIERHAVHSKAKKVEKLIGILAG